MGTLAPVHRAIVAADIEGSTTRTNPAKARLRQVMFDLFDAALFESGIGEPHRDPPVDRGDGVFVLIRPVDEMPKTRLLDTLVPTLSEMLGEHCARRPDQRFRLRAAVHAGEVHYDRRGVFGEALDITFRLLDAPVLKIRLRQTQAPLVLVASEDIYQSVIRHRYDGIDDTAFEPLVHLKIAERSIRGWVCVPAAAAPVINVYPRGEAELGGLHHGRQPGSGRRLAQSSDQRAP